MSDAAPLFPRGKVRTSLGASVTPCSPPRRRGVAAFHLLSALPTPPLHDGCPPPRLPAPPDLPWGFHRPRAGHHERPYRPQATTNSVGRNRTSEPTRRGARVRASGTVPTRPTGAHGGRMSATWLRSATASAATNGRWRRGDDGWRRVATSDSARRNDAEGGGRAATAGGDAHSRPPVPPPTAHRRQRRRRGDAAAASAAVTTVLPPPHFPAKITPSPLMQERVLCGGVPRRLPCCGSRRQWFLVSARAGRRSMAPPLRQRRDRRRRHGRRHGRGWASPRPWLRATF